MSIHRMGTAWVEIFNDYPVMWLNTICFFLSWRCPCLRQGRDRAVDRGSSGTIAGTPFCLTTLICLLCSIPHHYSLPTTKSPPRQECHILKVMTTCLLKWPCYFQLGSQGGETAQCRPLVSTVRPRQRLAGRLWGSTLPANLISLCTELPNAFLELIMDSWYWSMS